MSTFNLRQKGQPSTEICSSQGIFLLCVSVYVGVRVHAFVCSSVCVCVCVCVNLKVRGHLCAQSCFSTLSANQNTCLFENHWRCLCDGYAWLAAWVVILWYCLHRYALHIPRFSRHHDNVIYSKFVLNSTTVYLQMQNLSRQAYEPNSPSKRAGEEAVRITFSFREVCIACSFVHSVID